MVPDPYRALGLSHDATPMEIKRAYKQLAMRLHPDRLSRTNTASSEDIQLATAKFSKITSAYALLSDDVRKSQYDHIYKYGGYDDNDDGNDHHHYHHHHQQQDQEQENIRNQQNTTHMNQQQQQHHHQHHERLQKKKSIGYTVYNPVTYLLSKGNVTSKSVASFSLPTRVNGGYGYTLSTGQLRQSPSGNLEFSSKTTGFTGGQKFRRVEKAKVLKDGRKKVLIQGDGGYVERRFSKGPRLENNQQQHRQQQQQKRRQTRMYDDDNTTVVGDNPWYKLAWENLHEACLNPCGVIKAVI